MEWNKIASYPQGIANADKTIKPLPFIDPANHPDEHIYGARGFNAAKGKFHPLPVPDLVDLTMLVKRRSCRHAGLTSRCRNSGRAA